MYYVKKLLNSGRVRNFFVSDAALGAGVGSGEGDGGAIP